ncbi:MAG: IS21 family transposase [Clostridia bacterium]|nr:IS21 family transposase [Clostridia bacterium]
MAIVDTDTYRFIRRLYTVEGLSQRQIAKQLGVSRPTVKKYCEGSCMPGGRKEYQIDKSPLRMTLETEIIRIVNENKDAPKKQKLNAKVIWEMLSDSGYTVGESTIRKYIQELRIDKPEIFVPLEFEPGEAMEFDWGDVYAYIKKVKTRVSVFCAVLPYSYGIFSAVFPDKTSSSFFMGHVMAFEYFGGVPLRCIYDNLKSAVLEGSGKDAIKQEKFKKLEAHYAFEGIFCNVASGWEKGAVENLVSIIRKIAFTPMPWVESYQELQEHVTRKCVQYCMTHRIKTRTRTIKDMLDEEKSFLLPLPAYPLDPAEEVKANVYPDLTVRVGGVKYSVPPEFVGMTVTVKVSPFNIDIYHLGKLVWQHKKGMHQSDHQYIPEHYLEILQRKPRAIKNAVPINKGVMPPELVDFLKLCKEWDKNVQLVNILLLAKKLEPDTLLWAVRQANLTGSPSYDRVCLYLEILEKKSELSNLQVEGVKVKPADLKQYDKLIERSQKQDEKADS